MAALGRLVAELALDSAQFTEGLRRAQKGFDDFEKSLGRAALGAVTSFAGQLIALETASKVADAAISAFTETVKGLSALDDAAEKTGATVESLAKLQVQAKISGQSFESIEDALIKLNKGLVNADEETKGAGRALDFLGIKARDSSGKLRDAGEITLEVAKKLNEFSDKGPGKAALAIDLFGKAGAKALPFLKDLGDNVENLKDTFVGNTEAADKYEKAINALATQKEQLRRVIVSELLPAAEDFVNALLDMKKRGDGLAGTIKELAADGSLERWARQGALFIAEVIDKTIYAGNQFVALGKDLQGLALLAGAAFDQLASGAATAFARVTKSQAAMAEAIQLESSANDKYAKAMTLFAESTAIAAKESTKFADAVLVRQIERMAASGNAATDAGGKVVTYGGALSKASKEAEAFAKTLESLISKIQGKDTGVDSDFAKNLETLDKALAIGKISLGQYNQLLSSYIVSQKFVADADKKRIENLKAIAEAEANIAKVMNQEQQTYLEGINKQQEALDELFRSLEAQNEKLRKEADTLGLTDRQRTIYLLNLQREKDLKSAKSQSDIDNINRLYDEKIAIEGTKTAYEDYAKSLENSQKVQDSIAGFFEDLFLNGKKAFENLGQTVKKFFAQLASQFASKFVLNIVASLASGASGFANAAGSLFGGGEDGGGLGGIGSLFSAGSSLLGGSGIGTAVGVFDSVLAGTGSVLEGLTAGLSSLTGGATSFLGVLGPIGLAIGAIAAIASSLGLFENATGVKIDNSVLDGRGRKDIINSALGAFDVSGDVPNEAFKPLIDRVNQLDSFIADNLFSPEVLSVVRDNIQRISSDMTDWFGFDDEASAKIAIEKSSKLFLQQRYSIAFNALEEGAGDLITSFQGSADELLVYIDKLARSAFAIKQLNLAVPGLNLSIAAFSELTDTAQEAFTVLALSLESFVTDTNQTVADLIEASTRGAVTAYLDQADALLDLRDGLANGTVSIEDFAAGVGNLATAYAQATSKIAATKQALAELFGNTQEGFLLQSLNTEEKYAYYQRQAEQLFAALAAATDPEVIDRLARQIDAAQNAAFGLLSPEQQTALSGEFISGSQRVEDLVNARLAAAGDLLDKNNASLREVIRDALAEFAADIKDVADQERETADINSESARTPLTVRLVVDKYGDVEVANV